MLCLPQFSNQWLLRPYNHRENPDPAGLAKHPGAVGACGQTERAVLIAGLIIPTELLFACQFTNLET